MSSAESIILYRSFGVQLQSPSNAQFLDLNSIQDVIINEVSLFITICILIFMFQCISGWCIIFYIGFLIAADNDGLIIEDNSESNEFQRLTDFNHVIVPFKVITHYSTIYI